MSSVEEECGEKLKIWETWCLDLGRTVLGADFKGFFYII